MSNLCGLLRSYDSVCELDTITRDHVQYSNNVSSVAFASIQIACMGVI